MLCQVFGAAQVNKCFKKDCKKVTIVRNTSAILKEADPMAQTQMSANLKLINAVFAAMLVGMVGYFIYWGVNK